MTSFRTTHDARAGISAAHPAGAQPDAAAFALSDLVEVPAVQSLMESFYKLAAIPMGLIDLDGQVVVGAGWQDICTKFHRVHPETCRHCVESDTQLSAGVAPGEFKLYRCKNNMWDVATPVHVDGKHVGNVFSGQFFFDDEEIDRDLFRAQAKRYGFDEARYLAALDRVPRLSRQALQDGMTFFMRLADVLSSLSFGNLKLARAVAERDALTGSLRASEERLRLAQQAAHTGTWDWDLASGASTWSDVLWERYGPRPPSDPERFRAWLDRVFPADRDAVARAVEGATRAGTGLDIQWRVREPDGALRWFMACGQPIHDAEGRPERYVGIVLDATERKRAEEALRETNERLSLALGAARQAPWEVELGGGGAVFASAQLYELFGFSDEASRPQTQGDWMRAIVEEDHAALRAGVARALAGDGELHLRLRIRRGGAPDGELRWISAQARVQRSPDGARRRVVGVAADVTEATLRERQLGELTRLYAVLSRVNEAIVRTHEEQALFTDICQIIAEEAEVPLVWVGLVEDGERVTPAAAAGPAAEYVHQIRIEVHGTFGQGPTGTCVREDRTVINPDFDTNRATTVWREIALQHGFRSSASFPLRRAGAPIGALTIYGRDPNAFDADRVRLLDALAADISFALDAMAQERERAQAVLALRDRERSLREADQHKNDFLAMLSHELRNPLAPIRNSLFILDRVAPGSERSRRAHAVIDRQITHMTRLIDDLLDVTRITRGKIHLQCERLELNEVVRRTVEDHRTLFAGVGVELLVALATPPLVVDGDHTRIAQVVGNLLQNAAKFTPRGGIAHISVERDATGGLDGGAGSGEAALVRVRDSGAGISAEMLPRLFQPFMQADATLDRSKGGLGLGLALVKGLVELHGGAVCVHSDGPGRGAEFQVRLPLVAPLAMKAGGGADAAARAMPEGPESGPSARRVLIIEDNRDAAESLRDALCLDGHAVEIALTGTEGIEKARALRPQVVFCDIGLPGVDGYAVARALRAEPSLAGLLLVALSGYAQPEDLERSRQAGFDRHIAKPPDLATLERIVADLPEPLAATDSRGGG